ncbi:gamma carbonic anhydrase family protein [Caballeronia megalochromosomata]|nr:gamma carbonic anhydrase family protein [Caballeronia megalochromosomata]
MNGIMKSGAAAGPAPNVSPDAFIAQGAVLAADVTIGAQSSIWFNCVLRGDVQRIVIGCRTNIQDGTIAHGTTSGHPVIVGDDVTVGHGAILHACTLESGAFVGFGARVLDGATVCSGGMLAAGAVLTQGKRVGEDELWAGNPARLLRGLTPQERASMRLAATRYVELAAAYRAFHFSVLTLQETRQ